MNGKFRAMVGKTILVGACAYCGLLTIALLVSMIFKCELSQPVRDVIIIILTWFTTKAGTVIDHEYGSSSGSDEKTDFMMKQLTKKEEEPCAPPLEKPVL
jgi:hypothetical protein